ncbi:MAG: YtxH domain-containing protein [Clostridia bacterium]|nr:YtxH domain-containing protein [Clostridia bacterium]
MLGPFLLGAATAFIGLSLHPQTAHRTRPLLVKAVRGVLTVTDSAKKVVDSARDKVEEIVAEAQFENIQSRMEREINQEKDDL